jgi:hypothetical protein
MWAVPRALPRNDHAISDVHRRVSPPLPPIPLLVGTSMACTNAPTLYECVRMYKYNEKGERR